MRSRKNKILIVADGYPTDKNILTGIFVKQQVDIIRRLKPDWGVQVYFNPFFKIFSNTLVKKSFLEYYKVEYAAIMFYSSPFQEV